MSQKLKITINQTRVPVYKSRLYIVICSNIAKAVDYVEDTIPVKINMMSAEDRNTARAYTYAYETELGTKHFYLFLRHNSKIGEMVHEIKHVVNLIFSWHGVQLSLTNDEHECYFMEEITDRVMYTLAKYKKNHIKPRTQKHERITLDAIHPTGYNDQLVLDSKTKEST